MFNNYVWDMYLRGSGKEIVDFFEKSFSNEISKEFAERICEFHRNYCPSIRQNELLHDELLDIYADIKDNVWILEEGEYTIESAMKYVFNEILREEETPKGVFDFFSGSIEYLTTLISREIPNLFIPYYFTCNFNILENIAQEFEIELPEIPVKKDYEGRFFYYGKICESLLAFREEHNMTPYELYAFLYDFAPKYVGGIDSYIIKDLPEPKGVYFIGASKDDIFLKDNTDTITCWQCNPDTRAGDMIVMYLKTPVSAIDSIWRSVSIGFNDPFFYYYRCTYIANPTKIKQISQKKLQHDPVFKELPIVRKNLQGINGVELYPSVYNHLLDMAKSDLPHFVFTAENDGSELKIEKDVENKLIKPFLEKLGYSENDYVQQLQIRVGNHNFKLIPDFVVKPVVSDGHYSAAYHIEAKYSIPTLKELEEVKIQARSYAKILGAPHSVIASKEGIWISEKTDDYTEDIVSFSWSELNNEDNFYEVFKILGKGK